MNSYQFKSINFKKTSYFETFNRYNLLYWKKIVVIFRHDLINDWLHFFDHFSEVLLFIVYWLYVFIDKNKLYTYDLWFHKSIIYGLEKKPLMLKHFQKKSWCSMWLKHFKSHCWPKNNFGFQEYSGQPSAIFIHRFYL